MRQLTLTKTRFVMATGCPRKLQYARDPVYKDSTEDDDFLAALSDGGLQVGELARRMFPGGIAIDEIDTEAQVSATKRHLQSENVTLFEATIVHGNFLVRCDVLRKIGTKLEIFEVKAKSYDPSNSDGFMTKKGVQRVRAEWQTYLYDVAFQTYVLRAAYPQYEVTPHLMLLDKSVRVTMPGLGNQLFAVTSGRNARVVVSPAFDAESIKPPVLRMIDVSAEVEKLLQFQLNLLGEPQSFAAFASDIADRLDQCKDFPIVVGRQCKTCQFYAEPNEVKPEVRSGWNECMSAHTNKQFSASRTETIFALFDLREKLDTLIGSQPLRIQEMADHALPEGSDPKNKIDHAHRRHLQGCEARGEIVETHRLNHILEAEFASWQWPLHFIDFETSRPALPFDAGKRPYDQLLFQFSHHVLDQDGRLEHRTQFLIDPGVPPSLPSVRKLRDALSSDQGTVIHWWDHEHTVLKEIRDQLVQDPPDDHAELRQFLDSMLGFAAGHGRMADLGRLVHNAVYVPGSNGRSSIKEVLPAILRLSEPLRRRYSAPVYGTAIMPSLNFSDKKWVVEVKNKARSPYELLDPLLSDGVLEDLTRRAEAEESDSNAFVRNGGAAMIAYAEMQRPGLPAAELARLRGQLLRYCELDTLAMVMVYQALTLHGL